MAKKSANESLGRLRTGLSRETPASRAQESAKEASEESWTPATTSVGVSSSRAVERKVRVSVDLPRSEHKYLRDFAYDAETDAMSVMRTLLKEMEEDENLAERIQMRLTKRT